MHRLPPPPGFAVLLLKEETKKLAGLARLYCFLVFRCSGRGCDGLIPWIGLWEAKEKHGQMGKIKNGNKKSCGRNFCHNFFMFFLQLEA